MEKNKMDISEELRLAELKKETLHRSFDLVHAQANSILLFTLQWKDLEQHLDLSRKSLEKQTQEVDMNRKLLEERAREIETKERELGLVQRKIEECNGELASKEKQMGLVQRKIEECNGELERKEKQLSLVQTKIEECNGEIKSKEKQMGMVQKRFEECTFELQSKENELTLVRKSVEEWSEKLNLKREEVNLVQEGIEKCRGELTQLESLRSLIKDCNEKLELKYKELKGIQSSIEDCEKEYVMKEKHIASLQILIEDYAEELEAKEKLYDAIKKSIEDCDTKCKFKEEHLAELYLEEKKLELLQKDVRHCEKELESKKEDLDSLKEELKKYYDDLELKERELNGVRICIDECSQELAMKEKQLKLVQESIDECNKEFEVKKKQRFSIENSVVKFSKELELKEKQIYLMQNSVRELLEERESEELELDLIKRMNIVYHEELKEKEKHFDLFKKSLEERLQDLEMKERQFEEHVKEFELKERQFDSVQKSVEAQSKRVEVQEEKLSNILALQVKPDLAFNEAIGPLSPSLRLCIMKNGRNLQLLLNEHLKKHDMVCGEISSALKTADDPAKLVLDAVQGFYPPCSMERGMGFDVSIIRRSCILLLEQLLSLSPQINPQLRDEAMTLAGEWKAKMGVAAKNSMEVLGFLELLAAFRLASAFDGNELQCLLDVVSQHRQTPILRQALGMTDKVPVTSILPSQVKTERSEHSPVSNALDSFSASLQHSTRTEGRSLRLFLNEHLDEHYLMHDEVAAALHLSPDPAKFVLDLIEGSYSIHGKKRGADFEGFIRNYILLLEQLKKALPKISSQVKSKAMKLAVGWKSKMGSVTENSLEVLGFLQLLATYELVVYFNPEEILELLRTIAQHKQAPAICQALGFTDMVPAFVRKLIEKKQYIESIRFICAFKLMDKAPPGAIIQEYLENVKRSASDICRLGNNSPVAKDKATDFEITALRALVECIEDCKLEDLFLYENIKNYIVQLEKQKADQIHSVPFRGPTIQLQLPGKRNENDGSYAPTNQPTPRPMFQPQHGGKSHSIGASSHRDQLLLGNHHKRPRIDPTVVRTYTPQSPAPVNLYMSSSAERYGPGMAFNGRQTQFDIASNHLRATTNMGAGRHFLYYF